MDPTTGFLVYAALFRLAIIGAGITAIVLGYHLFVRGVMPTQGTDVEAQTGDIKLTFKNAAPGTCFALLGIAVIAVMLIQGNPELVVRDLNKVHGPTGVEKATRTVQLKGGGEAGISGDESHAFQVLVAYGDERRAAGDNTGAMAAYARALGLPEVTLGQAAPAVNQVAELYHGQQRFQEALSLARLAVGIEGNNANFLQTLAAVLEATGHPAEALKMMEKAAGIDPTYKQQLEDMRSRR